MPSADILKLRQGNYRFGRKIPQCEAQAPQAAQELREPPDSLGPLGRKMWRETGRLLLQHGMLTSMDWQSFELACMAYEKATGGQSADLGRWRAFSQMFGLSPKHRADAGVKLLPKILTGSRPRG